jgi:hypothetical protein
MSPTLRERVLIRARGRCEACLNAEASFVVHESPGVAAWRLRAMCLGCRFRMMVRDGLDVFSVDRTPAMFYEDVRRRRR